MNPDHNDFQTHPVVWVRRTQPGTTFGGAEAKLPSELVVESGVHRTPTLECEALREKLRFSDQKRNYLFIFLCS